MILEGLTGLAGLGFSVAGLFVGIAVGATGVGGGSLMTPILIMFYGISPAVAVGTDLVYASLSKSYGVFLHHQRKTLDWGITLRLAIGSVPAALLTLWWLKTMGSSPEVDRIIKITLACAVMATASFTLLHGLIIRDGKSDGDGVLVARFGRERLKRWQLPATIFSGFVIGAVVTISSVGAGAIGMMLLLLLYPNHAPIRLVSADLAHAVLITGIAGLGHASLGTVNYSMLAWLLLGALPGIYLGSRISFRLDAKSLKRAISGILVVVGALMLYKVLS